MKILLHKTIFVLVWGYCNNNNFDELHNVVGMATIACCTDSHWLRYAASCLVGCRENQNVKVGGVN